MRGPLYEAWVAELEWDRAIPAPWFYLESQDVLGIHVFVSNLDESRIDAYCQDLADVFISRAPTFPRDVKLRNYCHRFFLSNSHLRREIFSDYLLAKLHARGVAKRLGVKHGLIYLPGLPSMTYEDSDQEVYFRQRRYFYYLSGLNKPDCFVTYHIKSDFLTAWIPPQNYGRSVLYNGQNPTPEETMAISDFDTVELNTGLREALSKFAHREKGKIYLLHDFQTPAISQTITWRTGETTSLSSLGSRFDVTSLKSAMNASRAIKSPYEIKCIRMAGAITDSAHRNVLRALRGLSNEAHVEAVFQETCISNQAKSQAYGVIAGSGTNASLLRK